jgi:hypothetical protein
VTLSDLAEKIKAGIALTPEECMAALEAIGQRNTAMVGVKMNIHLKVEKFDGDIEPGKLPVATIETTDVVEV